MSRTEPPEGPSSAPGGERGRDEGGGPAGPEPGDPIGEATLAIMADAARYNAWMARIITPHLGSRVLELGAGIGNMTPFFFGKERVVASDPDPAYLAFLTRRMAPHPQVTVAKVALPEIPESLAGERLDTAVLLNVLEHVDEDVASLDALRRTLVPGGRVVIYVPAMPVLYGSLDRALSHFRRYSAPGLRDVLTQAGFQVVRMRYYNALGALGWWWNSRIVGRTILPRRQVMLFDRLVPLISAVEDRVTPPWGQSLLAVAKTPE